jgi:hypothetical protein
MKPITRTLAHAWPATVATAALLAACALAPALAARVAAPLSPADAAYQQQRGVCLGGQSNQDLATCLSEAVSARDQSRRGQLLTDNAQTLAANALLRCRVHRSTTDREACENMVRGEGQVSGTAQSGGLIRQFTTLLPGTAESTEVEAPAKR